MSMIRPLSLIFAACMALPVLAQEPLKPVKLIITDGGGVETTRQFFGHVVARQTVDLAFQVGGQLNEFPVIEGAVLGKGDLVAELDLETFELALEQAQLQRDQAKRTVARLEQLSGTAASRVQIDDAKTNLSLLDVAVRNAEFNLRHATLSAPFDALVASRNVANFTTISAGTPVVRLHDMSEIRIEVDIPEVLFLRDEDRTDIEIFAKFPSSDKLYAVGVREFNAESSEIAQSFRVTLGLAPDADLNVLPGASATVIATLKEGEIDGILLPHTAVFVDELGQPSVMVFSPKGGSEGTLTKVAVEVTPTMDGGVIVTEGLEPGSEIVATGGAALKDGQAVRRFAGFGN